MTDERAYSLAWSMFHRRCTLDGFEADSVDAAWMDPGVREFWLAEARHVLDHLASQGA